jgi:mxaA protein
MHRFSQLCILIFFVHSLSAYEDPRKYPDIDPSFATVSVIDPEQKVGYTVGDLLDRTIVVKVKKPYQLIEESLPIVGYEKRYRGQLLGMDLNKISFIKQDDKRESVHTIQLQYQIFTNNVVAKPAFVTADYYRIMDPAKPDDVFKLRIPELTIAISPIAIFGDIKVENDMSGYRGPILINAAPYLKNLKVAIFVLLFSIFILIYIYSRFTWVPKQNKYFSYVYRKFKKTKVSQDNLEDLLKALHDGFDKTLNQTLFLENLHQLYQQNRAFKYIHNEIEIFFQISRGVFFEKNKEFDNETIYDWLKQFALHCRMCERKLIVDSNDLVKLKI